MVFGLLKSFDTLVPGAVVAGALVWVCAQSIYTSITKSVVDDVNNSMIEILQTYRTPYATLLCCRAAANFLYDFILLAIVGGWLILAFQVDFAASPQTLFKLIVLLALLMPAAVGYALCFSGVLLVFKKAQSAILVGVVILLVLTSFDLSATALHDLLPISSISHLVTGLFVGGHVEVASLIAPFVAAFAHLIAGWLVFQYSLNRAKRLGRLGHR